LSDINAGNAVAGVGLDETNQGPCPDHLHGEFQRPAATKRVSVTAAVQGTTVKSTATLTVAGEQSSMSFGTGNTIDILNEAQYGMPFAIEAIDGAGNPVHGATIDLKIESVNYRKGQLVFGTFWGLPQTPRPARRRISNNNGILDPGEISNGNGQARIRHRRRAVPEAWDFTTATATVPEGACAVRGRVPEGSCPVGYDRCHRHRGRSAGNRVDGIDSSSGSRERQVDYNNASTAPPGETSPYGIAKQLRQS